MSDCTCPCPPPSPPCQVHFVTPGEAGWIDIKEIEGYHPNALLRTEFQGKLCRRCGAKLSVTSRLCPSCDAAVAKQRANAESWMKTPRQPYGEGSIPGRTF